MSISFTPIAENAWIYDTPEAERCAHLNALLLVAHKATRLHAPASGLSSEHAHAFQRVYDMLSLAVPQMLNVQTASNAKGTAAESSMDALIADAFPSWQLRDMSHKSHCGDRMLVRGDSAVLLEFKDYRRTVPSKEVQKFERDVRETSVRVGVMCVFEANIARKPANNITIESVGTSVAIFLPNAGRDGAKLLLALEFATWLADVGAADEGGSDARDVVRMYASAAECLNEADTMQRELSSVSEHMSKELRRLDEVRLTYLTALRTRLQQLRSHGGAREAAPAERSEA